MKTILLARKAFMFSALLALLAACTKDVDPCETELTLEFNELEGEVRFDQRFGMNIILGIPAPGKIDGTDYYVPCNIPDEFTPGTKIKFTAKGQGFNPRFDSIIAGDVFYTIILSKIEAS